MASPDPDSEAGVPSLPSTENALSVHSLTQDDSIPANEDMGVDPPQPDPNPGEKQASFSDMVIDRVDEHLPDSVPESGHEGEPH